MAAFWNAAPSDHVFILSTIPFTSMKIKFQLSIEDKSNLKGLRLRPYISNRLRQGAVFSKIPNFHGQLQWFFPKGDRSRTSPPPLWRPFLSHQHVLSAALPLIILRYDPSPFRQGFFCNDQSLMYPYKESTVSSDLLIGGGIGIAFATVGIPMSWFHFRLSVLENQDSNHGQFNTSWKVTWMADGLCCICYNQFDEVISKGW
jgi:hypothetical protein